MCEVHVKLVLCDNDPPDAVQQFRDRHGVQALPSTQSCDTRRIGSAAHHRATQSEMAARGTLSPERDSVGNCCRPVALFCGRSHVLLENRRRVPGILLWLLWLRHPAPRLTRSAPCALRRVGAACGSTTGWWCRGGTTHYAVVAQGESKCRTAAGGVVLADSGLCPGLCHVLRRRRHLQNRRGLADYGLGHN